MQRERNKYGYWLPMSDRFEVGAQTYITMSETPDSSKSAAVTAS